MNSEPNHTTTSPKAKTIKRKLKRTSKVETIPLFKGVFLQMKFTGFCKIVATTKAQIMGNKILHGLEKQPFPYYDMTLDNEVFEDMEITMCPQISEGNRIIIRSLVDKYNQKAIVKESSLKGLI